MTSAGGKGGPGSKIRSHKTIDLTVGGAVYSVAVVEIPFREGVELRCWLEGEEIRISDRQLGQAEALRLLAEKISRLRSDRSK